MSTYEEKIAKGPSSYFICEFVREEPILDNRGDTRIFVEPIHDSEVKISVPKFMVESVETKYTFQIYPCILSNEFYDPYNVDPYITNEFLEKLDKILSSPHVNLMSNSPWPMFDKEKEYNGETNWEWICKIWNYMNPDHQLDLKSCIKPDYRAIFKKF